MFVCLFGGKRKRLYLRFAVVKLLADQHLEFLSLKGGCTGSSESTLLSNATLLEITLSKGARIRNRYYQVPHLTQDTNGKVPNSQLDTANESQEVSPFPAGDHKAHINRRAQRHSNHKTEQNT